MHSKVFSGAVAVLKLKLDKSELEKLDAVGGPSWFGLPSDVLVGTSILAQVVWEYIIPCSRTVFTCQN